MGYKTITKISKEYGRTIPKMKIILAEEGLLSEDGPTQKALNSKIAELRPLDPETAPYGTNASGHFTMWDGEKIREIMSKRGESPGDRVHIKSTYDAVSAIEKAFELCVGMPGLDRHYVNYMIHSGHAGNVGLPIIHLDEDCLRNFRKGIHPVIVILKKKRAPNKEKAQKAIKMLVAVEDFLIRKGCPG